MSSFAPFYLYFVGFFYSLTNNISEAFFRLEGHSQSVSVMASTENITISGFTFCGWHARCPPVMAARICWPTKNRIKIAFTWFMLPFLMSLSVQLMAGPWGVWGCYGPLLGSFVPCSRFRDHLIGNLCSVRTGILF